MAEAMAVGRLWWRLAGARVRSQLQYRVSFALYTAAQFLASFVDFLALAAIFTKVDALGGWSAGEIAFLYGITGVTFQTCDMVVGTVDNISGKIRDGTFDAFLLRPVPALVQVSADGFALRRLGKMAQAVLVLVIASGLLDVAWTPLKAAVLVGGVLSGIGIFGAIWVGTASIAFWVVEGREFGNAFTYGGNFLANQPLGIYSRWLRLFVTFVLPIAFASYLPVAYVLDKPLPPAIPEAASFLSPLVAVVAVLLARWVWGTSIRHYRSTGS